MIGIIWGRWWRFDCTCMMLLFVHSFILQIFSEYVLCTTRLSSGPRRCRAQIQISEFVEDTFLGTMHKYIHNVSDDKFYVDKWDRVKGLRCVGIQQMGILYQVVRKALINQVTFEQRHKLSQILSLWIHREEHSKWRCYWTGTWPWVGLLGASSSMWVLDFV